MDGSGEEPRRWPPGLFRMAAIANSPREWERIFAEKEAWKRRMQEWKAGATAQK